MSLTKDWMTEDNLTAAQAAREHSAHQRALSACVIRACLFSDPRKVGAAFARAKNDMPADELAALQSITYFPYAHGLQT